ncbi:phosphonate C-P lyase system protein PhnH [Rhodobacterales bacterium 52_120_T64]|nr:phosphonate C-P lyase system protein PhnH [Rhodobacterales bacterium 52_120_T64]
MQTQSLTGGFNDAPTASATAFRVVLDVMARPGKISEITGATPPAPLSIAAGTLLLTLCDPETPLWMASSFCSTDIKDWLRFHTGAPIVESRSEAMFALGSWAELSPITEFAIGTPEYPDRSATLIVEMDALTDSGTILRGPGIKDTAELSLPEVAAFQGNAGLFPLGLDFFFTSGNRIAALPRTTKLGG